MLTIQDKAKQVQEAYSAFLEVYTLANPLPTLKTAKTERSDNLTLLGIAIVLVGATIASASHTIPTLVKDPTLVGRAVGFAFFVMIDLAIIIFAFFYTRISGSANIEQVKVLAKRGLFFVLTIAIGANLHYVMEENGFAVLAGNASIAWKLFDFGVSVLFALSAPIVAFISGEVMAITLAYRNSAQSRLDAEYAKELDEWRTQANEAWGHQKRHWGGSVKVDSVPVGALSDYNSSNLIKNDEITRQKPSVKLNKALTYLREHPEHLTTAPRELEKEIEGISYGTIHKAQVMLRSEVES